MGQWLVALTDTVERFPEQLDRIPSSTYYNGRPIDFYFNLLNLELGLNLVAKESEHRLSGWDADYIAEQITWLGELGVTRGLGTSCPDRQSGGVPRPSALGGRRDLPARRYRHGRGLMVGKLAGRIAVVVGGGQTDGETAGNAAWPGGG